MEAQKADRPMALSYSRLSTFEQCPQKFDYLYVTRNVKDPGSDASRYGNRVHKSLEDYGRTGDPAALTIETRDFKPLVDSIRRMPGQKYYELQMAVNHDCEPCDWKADDVWIRSIADVLVVNGKRAFCGDYKTGKIRDNPMQLQLFACMVFYLFPDVEEVKTSFLWLLHDFSTPATYKRRHVELMWKNLSSRFTAVQDAVDLGLFITKPSPLCGWCPAKDFCPDAQRRRR